ncbi:FAD-dependent oxidoreductase [Granulosicoccus antarcticus]|uniref:Mercuric reductase n=1 Tax=Granulosicoccus antarcticus IMCC3135 TaxID=1192854 RepID=A0A2Z2NUZ3_9GAMM|nr:FAD-dependent oxidoreductase [Granulosicoccus antarcticus]ASJ75372.1 Mercuric reductase [Granulosicoccus antarcticus IMCC3135]
MQNRKLLISVLVILVAGFFFFDIGRFFSLEYLKNEQAALATFYEQQPLLVIAIFFFGYIAVTALSLPGAAILTLAAGAQFGLLTGTVIVSFASTIGATLAFLVSRYLLRDTIESRFGDKLKTFNRNIEKDGAFYLFTVRLVPVFPFFLVNLVMGLTPLKTGVFYIVSQIGMLAGTLVFVNAGTQLAKIDSLSGILSPGLIFSFALLGIFPLVAKKVIDMIKAGKRFEGYTKPQKFDQDIVVLGAGSGGLVSAYIGAVVKAKVTLIEKAQMGGDCLNTGCVPSKALIRSGKLMHNIKNSEKYGIQNASGEVDFAKTMQRVHDVIAKIEPHDSVERYSSLGVNVIQGEGRITSPWTVEVNGQTLTTRNIIIATGGSPFVPPIPGLDKVNYLTSHNLWELKTHPKRLVVLGGGPIGCELTQSFRRLGSEVVQVEQAPQIMGREDPDVAEMIRQRFVNEGVQVMVNTKAVSVELNGDEKSLVCEANGETIKVPFDEIIIAVGRKANTSGFGLEELKISLNKNGTVATNEYLQTDFPNIYAVGDVAGPYQFTHVAAHQAWYAAVNSLFGMFKKFRADYRVIPWATFTDPEVARVGLNESDAKEQNIAYELTTYGIDDLDRAIADSSDYGVVKVLTKPGKDKILGVTIVGEHAGDLIAEYVLAMKHGLGLNKILGTIHIYPTLSEANKYAAGEWKRAHQPEKLLAWVEKFHTWRRG